MHSDSIRYREHVVEEFINHIDHLLTRRSTTHTVAFQDRSIVELIFDPECANVADVSEKHLHDQRPRQYAVTRVFRVAPVGLPTPRELFKKNGSIKQLFHIASSTGGGTTADRGDRRGPHSNADRESATDHHTPRRLP